MTDTTAIEWADSTFNPWEGCTKVGPGCDHCYAENRNARFAGGQAINWGPGVPRRRTSRANWQLPVRWNSLKFLRCTCCQWRGEERAWQENMGMCPGCGRGEVCDTMLGARRRVFCASLADVFDNEVDLAWRADLFALIAATPNLDWLLLTKRIGNADRMIREALGLIIAAHPMGALPTWPWPNLWLGATVCNQDEADRDIPKLLATPARTRFLSIEPMLGPVDLGVPLNVSQYEDGGAWSPRNLRSHDSGLHWVIAGGESGPKARPSHPDWFRVLRDQCSPAGVKFLLKQHGEWRERDTGTASPLVAREGDPEFGRAARQHDAFISHDGHVVADIDFAEVGVAYRGIVRVGKKAAGRLLDGVEHNGFPEVRS